MRPLFATQIWKGFGGRALPVELSTLFDPELVFPSDAAKSTLEFWARLQGWTDPLPRLGEASLQNLAGFMEDPPTVIGLSSRECWQIMLQLCSRGFEKSPEKRVVCEPHIREHYTSVLGEEGNIERLLEGLSNVDPRSSIMLAPEFRCWSMPERSCSACDSEPIHRVTTPKRGYEQARRSSFLASKSLSATAIQKCATQMFPNLIFTKSAWTRVGTLTGGPSAIAQDLVHHLGVLNDHAPRIWAAAITSGERQQLLGAHGIDASLEGPKTHRNEPVMKARRFSFNGVMYLCEWHTKLKPNTNRVHFHVDGDKVRIGAIVDYLPV